MVTEIKLLTSQDINEFIELVKVFENVFGMNQFHIPGKEHLQKTLSNPGFLTLVAMRDGEVIGGLTAYALDQYYSEKPLAYIYDLAVLTQFQRQGIGKNLVSFLNNYCREKGFEEVFVQADKVDDYAIEFYRSTNPTNEEQVIHFYYSLEKAGNADKGTYYS